MKRGGPGGAWGRSRAIAAAEAEAVSAAEWEALAASLAHPAPDADERAARPNDQPFQAGRAGINVQRAARKPSRPPSHTKHAAPVPRRPAVTAPNRASVQATSGATKTVRGLCRWWQRTGEERFSSSALGHGVPQGNRLTGGRQVNWHQTSSRLTGCEPKLCFTSATWEAPRVGRGKRIPSRNDVITHEVESASPAGTGQGVRGSHWWGVAMGAHPERGPS